MPQDINQFNLGKGAFINYSPKLEQLVITRMGKTKPRHIILDRNGMIRLRVYLNDLLKKGL